MKILPISNPVVFRSTEKTNSSKEQRVVSQAKEPEYDDEDTLEDIYKFQEWLALQVNINKYLGESSEE